MRAGWKPTGISSCLGGLHDFTHSWKNPTERDLLAIPSTHSPRYGKVKGDAGASLSNVGGVGRDHFLIYMRPP